MTNDITTISGAAQEVIDHLEQHLYDKGVLDARFNPATGILGLVDRIPDIEPSVNINLTIDLSLSSSHSSIHYGESVVLTATLLASYEGVSEVDLQTGEITGATIIFKNGSTIIGTGTTDSNGVATLTYTPTVSETTLSINAVFDGTDNFNPASSRNVSIEVNDYLDLTSDKSILSYADNDNCIFTATYYGVTATGRSINLYNAKDDSLIGVMNDNNDGTYSYTYQSRGVGDLEVYAKDLGSFVSKTYEVSDRLFYDNATSDKSSKYVSRSVGNGKSCTISYANNEYHLTASGSNVSWYGVSPISVSTNDNWEITSMIKVVQSGENSQYLSIGLADGGANHIEHILYPRDNPTKYAVYGYGSPNSYIIPNTNCYLTTNNYYTFKITLINNEVSFKLYNGETLIIDRTYILPSNYENIDVYPVVSCFGNINNNNISTYFKEYSVKPL